jgi:probable selenium-dependent hydroxylase accessory protein YqeC
MYRPGLSRVLGLENKAVLSFVGVGGKTSAMFLVAEENVGKKVFLTTTAKIYIPKNHKLILGDSAAFDYEAQRGVNVIGNPDNNISKIKSLSFNILEKIYPRYDLTLIEADGSKNLPLKGWGENEPVIFKATTHTIGIVTLNGLGKVVSFGNVHRPENFIQNTGAYLNAPVTAKHIALMVTGQYGMFKNSSGKRILIINQVEDLDSFKSANILKKYILESGFNIDMIITGSAKQNKWIVLYKAA